MVLKDELPAPVTITEPEKKETCEAKIFHKVEMELVESPSGRRLMLMRGRTRQPSEEKGKHQHPSGRTGTVPRVQKSVIPGHVTLVMYPPYDPEESDLCEHRHVVRQSLRSFRFSMEVLRFLTCLVVGALMVYLSTILCQNLK